MKKQVTAVLVAAVMLICMMPRLSFASEAQSGTEKTEVATASMKGILASGGLLESSAKKARTLSAYDHSHDQEIISAMENVEESLDVRGFGITTANAGEIISNLVNTNPQIFYIEKWGWSYYSSGEVVELRFTYDDSVENIRTKQKKVDQAVEEALESVDTSSMTEEEIALAFHDYLAANIAYDYDNLQNSTLPEYAYDIYGAFVEKKAVCQGYALAYMYLLQKENISCGIASSQAANHAWNVIEIDGNWYHADATWDDPVYDNLGRVMHNYFLISTDTLLSDEAKKSDYITETPITESYQEATDKSLEDEFWTNSETVIHYYDENWYYADKDEFKIVKYHYSQKNEETLLQDDYIWRVVGSNISYYPGNFSRMAGVGSQLYYTTPTEIYKMNLDNGESLNVYSPDCTDGYLYGLGIQDDMLAYVVKATPNSDATETVLKTNINIKHTHSWKEISRTEATCMNDGEIIQKCEECGMERTAIIPATKDISGYKLSLSQSNYEYDGTEKQPEITLKDGDATVPAQNYTVRYINSDGIGTASASVTGTNGYKGTVEESYVISHTQHKWDEGTVMVKPTCLNKGERQYACVYSKVCKATKKEEISPTGSIADCTLTLSQSSYEYDGNSKSPTVTLKDGERVIPADNYTMRYIDNNLPGDAFVELTGKNGLTGTIRGEFKIIHTQHKWSEGRRVKEPTCMQEGKIEYHCLLNDICRETKTEPIPATKDISGCKLVLSQISVIYNGKAQKPGVSLYDGTQKIPVSVYRINYENNINVGTAKIDLEGIGDYTGSVTGSFTIRKAGTAISAAGSYTKTYGSGAFSLGATAASGGKLSYKSSDTKVAAVSSDGRVTLKGPGRATITITAAATASYNGATKRVTITVKPKKTAGLKVKKGKKRMTVRWKRDSKATGYQITYAQNKKFKKGKKNITVRKNKTTKKTIKKLKAGKTYYVKVRAYKNAGKTKLYGSYSGVKKVKIR